MLNIVACPSNLACIMCINHINTYCILRGRIKGSGCAVLVIQNGSWMGSGVCSYSSAVWKDVKANRLENAWLDRLLLCSYKLLRLQWVWRLINWWLLNIINYKKSLSAVSSYTNSPLLACFMQNRLATKVAWLFAILFLITHAIQ